MEIYVNELDTTIDILPDRALLDPAVLRQIVEAVTAELRQHDRVASWERRERAADSHGSEGRE